MRRALAALAALGLFSALVAVGIPAQAAPVEIEAPYEMTWDASTVKNAQFVDIACFGYWSTWRSPKLPLAGSWVYKSSGSPGVTPDYIGRVQCYIKAHLKSGKAVYVPPVVWAFEVTA